MFDPKKLMDMMSEAQKAQGQLEETLKHKTAEGESGAGMVKITLNGQFELTDIQIDESLLKPSEATFLQDMIKGAYNDAAQNIRAILKDEMMAMQGQMGSLFGDK